MTHRTLNITLDCDPSRFQFELSDLGDAQYRAFVASLGRQLFYAMRYAPGHPTLNASIAVVIGQDMTDAEIGMYLQTPDESRGFMCAAVSRSDGTNYSYHS